VHSLHGRRVNDVLSRALAFALGRLHKRDVAVTITDTGFALTAMVPLNVQKALKLLKSEELGLVMKQALEKTQVLSRRFRHCAARSLMILRTYKGDQKSVGKQQMNSRLLLSAVKRISDDFPILKEARREVLEDLMDLDDAAVVLHELENGTMSIEEVMTELPSPFAFNIILQGYSDILKMEDRIEFLKRMHQMILAEIDAEGKDDIKKKVTKEKIDFSYESVWREAEEKRLEDWDEHQELLKKEAWNLSGTPLFAKEEIVKLIDGADDIRTDVKRALVKYKGEILRTWPPELVRFVFEKLGMEYDKALLKAGEEQSLLRRQLKQAARKTGMDPLIERSFNDLIDGKPVEHAEFWTYVDELLKGTIPKAWGDELVRFLKHAQDDRACGRASA